MPARTPAGARHRAAIANALRTVRELQGVTQSSLADGAGVQQQLISRYESDLGGIEPSASTIFLLEEAMGVPHGSVLRAAGMIDDSGNDVESVLARDPGLSEAMREVVLQTYRIARRATNQGAATKPVGRARSRRAAAQ